MFCFCVRWNESVYVSNEIEGFAYSPSFEQCIVSIRRRHVLRQRFNLFSFVCVVLYVSAPDKVCVCVQKANKNDNISKLY